MLYNRLYLIKTKSASGRMIGTLKIQRKDLFRFGIVKSFTIILECDENIPTHIGERNDKTSVLLHVFDGIVYDILKQDADIFFVCLKQ